MTYTEYAAAAREYIASLPSAGKAGSTVTTCAAVLRSFGAYCAEKGENKNITTAYVTGWRAQLARTCSDNTINMRMHYLSAFYEWAVRLGLAASNPVARAEYPKKTETDYVLLSLDELQKVLHEPQPHLKYRRSKNITRDRAIVTVLITTGLRNSEMRSLRLSDLDFTNGQIKVRNGKGKKNRIVPFPSIAQQAVKGYLAGPGCPKPFKDSYPLFGADTSAWHGLSATSLNTAVKNYVISMTGKDIHCHTLRHCYTALCDYRGVPLRDVSATLGHSSIRTTENVYLYVLDKQKSARSVSAALNNL